jgi:uncharacterized membrane protein
METAKCSITQREFPCDELIPLSAIRPKVARLIRQEHPELEEQSLLCLDELNRYRGRYVRQLLEADLGEVSALDDEVVRSLKEHDILADNIDREFDAKATFGERLSDKIASFGGSWTFILSFGAFLLLWVVINIAIFRGPKAPDPYPFIFLNLILSCIAALQAPVIMMSQNRQEVKDRMRGENDYKINLKAELEIRHLHEKLDFLLKRQSQHFFEIQQIQMELMEDVARPRRNPKPE